MTPATMRARWHRALAAAAVPASLRPMKAALLSLARLMSPKGELHAWRDEMTEATGLPTRTLTRQLQRAVESGWLVRDVPGGHGRRSRYRATIPGESCEPSVAHNCPSCGPSARTQLPEVVGHLAAHSIKTEHSRQRVPSSRRPTPQTTHHDGSRAERDHDVTSQAAVKGSGQRTPFKRPSYVTTTAGEHA